MADQTLEESSERSCGANFSVAWLACVQTNSIGLSSGTDGKRINMQTRFRLDKVLDQASLMNGMVVTDQNNRTGNTPQ